MLNENFGFSLLFTDHSPMFWSKPTPPHTTHPRPFWPPSLSLSLSCCIGDYVLVRGVVEENASQLIREETPLKLLVSKMVAADGKNRDRMVKKEVMEFPHNDQVVTVAFHGEEMHDDLPLAYFSKSPLNVVFYLLYLHFLKFHKICQFLHFSFPLCVFCMIKNKVFDGHLHFILFLPYQASMRFLWFWLLSGSPYSELIMMSCS